MRRGREHGPERENERKAKGKADLGVGIDAHTGNVVYFRGRGPKIRWRRQWLS